MFAVLVAVIALAAGCSSTGGEASSGFPDGPVTDVSTGEPVTLTSVTKPGLPTLVWFWAPH